MSGNPYRIARQEHLGDALDDLAHRGLLTWEWDYDVPAARAVYRVRLPHDDRPRVLDTKAGEQLVKQAYDGIDVPWLPVPSPGGRKQAEETRARIAALRG